MSDRTRESMQIGALNGVATRSLKITGLVEGFKVKVSEGHFLSYADIAELAEECRVMERSLSLLEEASGL